MPLRMSICIICNANQVIKLLNWGDFSIFRCKHCKVIFSYPLPDDEVLEEYYQGFLYNISNRIEGRKYINRKKNELKRLFQFDGTKSNLKFLDYGGGTGIAYQAAKELNLRVYYHDLDKKATTYVKETYGLLDDFVVNDIKNTKYHFNYIFSDNVIEHVKDPVKYLADLKNVLEVNGKLVVKTPHAANTEVWFYPLISIKGYFLRAMKYNSPLIAIKAYFIRFWHCDPPRHLYSFSKESMKIIAKQAGFNEKELAISYYRIPLFKYSLTEMFFNVRKYNSYKSFILRILIILLLPFEVVSKILQVILISTQVITPGGIIITVNQKSN